MMTTSPKTQTPNLTKTLSAIVERAKKIEADAKAERLEAQRALRIARGTGDVREQAEAAVAASTIAKIATKLSLADKIEAVLRGPFAPLGIRELAAAVEAPVGRVLNELKRLRTTACPTRSKEDAAEAKQIYNLGTEDDPRWIWVLGDETSPEELSAMVRKMISYRPLTFSQLTLATGARRGRLSGRLVQMQRDGEALDKDINLPNSRTYRWFISPKASRKR